MVHVPNGSGVKQALNGWNPGLGVQVIQTSTTQPQLIGILKMVPLTWNSIQAGMPVKHVIGGNGGGGPGGFVTVSVIKNVILLS